MEKKQSDFARMIFEVPMPKHKEDFLQLSRAACLLFFPRYLTGYVNDTRCYWLKILWRIARSDWSLASVWPASFISRCLPLISARSQRHGYKVTRRSTCQIFATTDNNNLSLFPYRKSQKPWSRYSDDEKSRDLSGSLGTLRIFINSERFSDYFRISS